MAQHCLPVGTEIITPLIAGGPWIVSQDWGCTSRALEEPDVTNCSNGPCFTCNFFHAGIDITGSRIFGTTVYALAAGTVTHIGDDIGDCDFGAGCGVGGGDNAVCVNSGALDFWFFHLSAHLVSVGDDVAQDQALGRVGTCGCSTGPHLHFQVMPHGEPTAGAKSLNPCAYLASWPNTVGSAGLEETTPGWSWEDVIVPALVAGAAIGAAVVVVKAAGA